MAKRGAYKQRQGRAKRARITYDKGTPDDGKMKRVLPHPLIGYRAFCLFFFWYEQFLLVQSASWWATIMLLLWMNGMICFFLTEQMVTICWTVLLAEASSPTVDSTSPLKTWSVDEVVKFMEKSELAEHAGMFKEHVSEKKYLILCPFDAIIRPCLWFLWVTLEVNRRSRPVDFFLLAAPSLFLTLRSFFVIQFSNRNVVNNLGFIPV